MKISPFLTGAQGCIGAWVLKALVEQGFAPTVFDKSEDHRRLNLVLSPEQLDRVKLVRGDITDASSLQRALEASGAKQIIHLAGLQVPFCKAKPSLGAMVNVVGTVNVFEAALACGLERVVYASSAAVYGPMDGAVDEHATTEPTNLYGVYKLANEGTARIYYQDHGLSSIGLRPLTVYGVARDQGMTSDVTRAMKAAVLKRPFTIRFGGTTDLLYTADAADAFVQAALRGPDGAQVYNLHGDATPVEEVVQLIAAEIGASCDIDIQGPPLPIASAMDGSAIRHSIPDLLTTPLREGVRATIDTFNRLEAAGKLDAYDLDT